MMRISLASQLSLVVLLICVLGTVASGADNDAVMNDGKRATITISTETLVDGQILAPGKYRVQHRVDASEHVMHFQPVRGKGPEIKAKVTCKLDPDREKWTRTSIGYINRDGKQALAKIEIRGERISYSFN